MVYKMGYGIKNSLIRVRQLLCLSSAVKYGSISKAAEKNNMKQSNLSVQIRQLEEELGCLLFERINHTITLTERGRELVSYAHQVRALTDEFKESLTKDEELSGHIHIVTPDSVCDDMINANYIDFHNRYPNISIKFTTADTLVMFDMLDHNEADVIITLDNHSYNKDYVIAKEEQLSMHFVASSNSKFAGKKNLKMKDIINEPFILTEYGQGYRRVLDKELAKRSLEITPILEIGRTDMITSLVAKGDMISFLPDFVTKEYIDSGELCYLDIKDMNMEIWKQLIYHKNKWMSKTLRTLINYIIENDFSH